jgi:hypothetical protein
MYFQELDVHAIGPVGQRDRRGVTLVAGGRHVQLLRAGGQAAQRQRRRADELAIEKDRCAGHIALHLQDDHSGLRRRVDRRRGTICSHVARPRPRRSRPAACGGILSRWR